MMMLSFKKFLSYATIIVAGGMSGFFLTKLLIFFSFAEQLSTFLIMFFFGILLFLPPLAAFIKKKIDIFEPIYLWLFIYGFFYLLNPFVQTIKREPFLYGGEFLNEALWLAIIGLICFYLGYYGVFGRKIASCLPVIKRQFSSKKLTIIAWLFVIIGFWGLNNYIQTSGGWLRFWSKPHGFGGQALKTTAYIYQLPELMVVGFLLICETLIHKTQIQKKKLRFFDVTHIIAAALGGIGIYTIIWGSRTLYSWVIISIVVLYFLTKGKRPKLRFVILGLFLLFFILTIVPMYRVYLHIGGDLSKIFSGISPINIVRNLSHEGDEFHTYLAEIALVPNSVPYDNFNLYGRFLIHPIPRLIWENKPAFLNSKWEEFLGKSGVAHGAAESMLGDFYAQWGFWAIVLGTFLAGVFWKTIYEYLRQNIRNRSAIILYAIILPNMFTFIAQSALIAFLKWLPYMVPATIIALLFARENNPPKEEIKT